MFSDYTHKRPSFQLINQDDDKFFSKLLSREASTSPSESSFTVYYGGVPGSVPFFWESQPGTPKHDALDDEIAVPPLTPPPSYGISSEYGRSSSKKKFHSKSNLLRVLFLKSTWEKFGLGKSMKSPSSDKPTRVGSAFVPLANPPVWNNRGRLSSRGSCSSCDSSVNDEEQGLGSPTSTLCFGIRRSGSAGPRGVR